MKIVINTCYGGFGLSQAAAEKLAELGHKGAIEGVEASRNERSDWGYVYIEDLARNDPRLIQVVEELGLEAASGRYSELWIEEVDETGAWYVHEYDGKERVEFYDICDRKIPLLDI